jgi:DNA-binding transcriptional ArsR family regulator
VSVVLAAIASPRRRAILRLIWDRERSAGDIQRQFPDITFGAVSQHLKLLDRAQLVSCRAEGRLRLYRARKQPLGPLGEWLEGMWTDALAELKSRAEQEEARRGPRPRPAARKRHR